MSQRQIDIASLTTQERLDLLEQLWESLTVTPSLFRSPTPNALSLTDAWTTSTTKGQSVIRGTR